ncbi:MAG: DNA translocase FtsK [Ruminococcaceae bacterium]|jgi:S-DNA-T family DNA segregation ATPase FtsK/SpoIIIE|nr:DNA translocase FtsK [Oscillospiraceae bacterium]
MATKQKKTDTKGKSGTGQKKKKTVAPSRPAYNATARLVGGLVCLLLALCVVVSYFRVDALFLTFFARLLKGLFGYGYYLAAIVLAAAGVFLIDHKGRPVILRVTCTLLLVPLLGTLMHLLLSHGRYETGLLDMVKALWRDGQALLGGGVVSGAVAVGLGAVFGKVISAIVLVVLLLAALMGAMHVTPGDVAEAMRQRTAAREEDDDGDESFGQELPATARQQSEEERAHRRTKPVIDFPLDDTPVQDKQTELGPREGKSFYVSKPAEVRTPADVLDPAQPVDKPEEKKSRRRREKEASPAEVADAAAQVTKEIEDGQAAAEEVYQYPPITLLDQNDSGNVAEVGAELRNNSRRLAETLRSFGVDATPGEVVHGPSVTRYEFTLDQGVKLSKITNLSDDIALALGASGVRIAPIPNKISVVGIEVPNRAVTAVRIRDVIESRAFAEHKSRVAFAVGKDIGGSNIVGDISRLPHVLIAGTTGSGKSVCTNSLIVSLLYKSTPDEVRFIMVDPKMVELAPYNGIPHLLIPVVTDPKKAAGALQWAVFEMMKRYKTFSEKGVKDLAGFNALAENDPELKKLPTVVVVIDELADLMLVAAKEVEESICRVAQMGRAAGMHLVIATQRPSADVITGLMKANIPSRIAFAVASSLESRIILDTTGAEKLVGKGDMLYFPLGMQKPLRVQGCFITPEEIERVVAFVKDSGEAHYDQSVIDQIETALKKEEKGSKAAAEDEAAGDDGDELLPAAVEVLLEVGSASVSMLQRRLKLGYSRAARLVDQMEERGIVGPFEGSRPRQLLITRAQWQEMQMKQGGGETVPQPEIDRSGTISDIFDSHDALD